MRIRLVRPRSMGDPTVLCRCLGLVPLGSVLIGSSAGSGPGFAVAVGCCTSLSWCSPSSLPPPPVGQKTRGHLFGGRQLVFPTNGQKDQRSSLWRKTVGVSHQRAKRPEVISLAEDSWCFPPMGKKTRGHVFGGKHLVLLANGQKDQRSCLWRKTFGASPRSSRRPEVMSLAENSWCFSPGAPEDQRSCLWRETAERQLLTANSVCSLCTSYCVYFTVVNLFLAAPYFRGRYHGGRQPSNNDSFHSPTVIPPSALDKPSIMRRHHRR